MASIIVADEQEGRRNLLAGTLEREEYSVTRAGTLRQCEGTALATMPDVVLIDGEWKAGDAIDAASRLSSDPEFALKCRIVILSANVGEEYLISAAKAGVSEVLAKPVDMSKLLVQVNKHAKKLFVEPPADIRTGSGTGFFEVSVTPGDPSWSLPILQELLGEGAIDTAFVGDLVSRMDEDIEIGHDVLERLLRM
ncbi:MAG: response regulator, partial [Candidatus Thalassarchaeaceae archaeon]|nr:response regulator [Candidatus Thalassarchaeaceae archaeon]